MLIAGEASGDLLAAELVDELRQRLIARLRDESSDAQPLQTALAPRFFGAGGPKMAAAGVDLAFDLTQHSVIGFSDVFKNIVKFRRLFRQLLRLAIERQPDVIIGVDYGGFNLRFGKAIKDYVRRHRSEFTPWNPKLVQFVSPQVWASRPARAQTLADNYDLLLSIFPFEKGWYGRRVPRLRVEFVGHPMIGRNAEGGGRRAERDSPSVLLLPGSRADEVRRHLPVVVGAFELLRRELPALQGRVIIPSEKLKEAARHSGLPTGLEVQVGGLSEALAQADLAITKSGTITMECALHGVPAVVFYKTSWPTYVIGKQIITVKYIAMPNLLADEPVYPEFIQHDATPENISGAALELLQNEARRGEVKAKLTKVIGSLGGAGGNGAGGERDYEFAGMKDLTPGWIKLKGILFLLLGIATMILLVLETRSWTVALYLAIAIWCFCRFYYFAFYVIEKYVDSNYKFSGLWSFACYLMQKRRRP